MSGKTSAVYSTAWLGLAADKIAVLINRENYNVTPKGWVRKARNIYTCTSYVRAGVSILGVVTREHRHFTIRRDKVVVSGSIESYTSDIARLFTRLPESTLVLAYANMDMQLSVLNGQVLKNHVRYDSRPVSNFDQSAFARNGNLITTIAKNLDARLFEEAKSVLFFILEEAKEKRELLFEEMDEKTLGEFWLLDNDDRPAYQTLLRDRSTLLTIDAQTAAMRVDISANRIARQAFVNACQQENVVYRENLQRAILTELSDNSIYLDDLDIRYRLLMD